MITQTTPSLRQSLLRTSRPVQLSPGETYTGIVKWYNAQKGFGFITATDAPVVGDIFVHASAILSVPDQKLETGEEVRFRIQPGRGKNTGKIQAVDVELV